MSSEGQIPTQPRYDVQKAYPVPFRAATWTGIVRRCQWKVHNCSKRSFDTKTWPTAPRSTRDKLSFMSSSFCFSSSVFARTSLQIQVFCKYMIYCTWVFVVLDQCELCMHSASTALSSMVSLLHSALNIGILARNASISWMKQDLPTSVWDSVWILLSQTFSSQLIGKGITFSYQVLHAWAKDCLKRQWIILLACSWLWSPSSKHPKQYAVKTFEHLVKIWFVENSWMLKNILFSNKLSDVASWYAFWAASCSSLSNIFSVSSVNKVGSYADMIFSIELKISPRCRMLCRNRIFSLKKVVCTSICNK